jgi:transcriptional regulator with XRE-family HTH domain
MRDIAPACRPNIYLCRAARASANRWTDISVFSRSTTWSGMRAIGFLLKTCQDPRRGFLLSPHGQRSLRNNIGTAYTRSQAHTMSTPAIAELGFTIPPSIHCLGDLPVAEREESIGARISQLRKDKGMTQKELAERLEVSQPVVSDYENDVIRLPADIVGEIAQILEVTSDELLGLKREARSTGNVKNRRLSRRLQAIDALPKRDQEALLRTIDAFISKTA